MKARMSLAAIALCSACLASQVAGAGSIPIVISGFNQDVVVEAGAVNDSTTHYAGAVTATMDTGTAKTFYTWYEAGLPGGAGGGLPAAGVFTSAADPTTQFLLAPYNKADVLLLDRDTTSGTLKFAAPQAYTGLSFLTSSGLGSSSSPVLNLTINFADGTAPLTGLSIVSPDWFNNGPVALTAAGRVRVDTGTYDHVGSDNPRLYQENVTLPAAATLHPISSIDIVWSANGSTTAHTAIFAVSGAVPEPASVSMLSTGVIALALAAWRRRRLKLPCSARPSRRS
jgi:hypothetical protein